MWGVYILKFLGGLLFMAFFIYILQEISVIYKIKLQLEHGNYNSNHDDTTMWLLDITFSLIPMMIHL